MIFLDFFSGIGGFRLGMEQAGHTCKGHCEIDRFANISYNAIHQPKEGEWFATDIRAVEPGQLPDADCWCGGFPCQSFSVAGKRGGFEDTRGTLFFEIMRLAKARKPKYLLLENVAGLLSHDGGKTFGVILNTLGELGYRYEYQVLNSKNFGVPQNRERVFIIGHLGEGSGPEVFPIGESNGTADVIQGQTANTVTARTGGAASTGCFLVENKQPAQGIKQIGNISQASKRDNPEIGRIYSPDGIAPCLNTMQGGSREPKIAIPVLTPDRVEKQQNGRRFKEDGEPMFTLTGQDRHGVAIQAKEIANRTRPNEEIEVVIQENGDIRPHRMDKKKSGLSELNISYEQNNSFTVTAAHAPKIYGISTGMAIRKLTPRECFRLQGFPDWAFDRARVAGVSDSQLYKQAGNSVTTT